jgi:hypothetical protein
LTYYLAIDFIQIKIQIKIQIGIGIGIEIDFLCKKTENLLLAVSV